jgi:hypothetical protein
MDTFDLQEARTLAGWRAALPDGLGSWIVVPKPSWNAGVRWEQIDLLKRRQLIHDVFSCQWSGAISEGQT